MRKIKCSHCKNETGLYVTEARVGRWRATVTIQCPVCKHWRTTSAKYAIMLARKAGFLRDFHGA